MKIAVPRTAPIILFHSKESINASSLKPVFPTGKIRGDITRPSLDVIAAKRRIDQGSMAGLGPVPGLKKYPPGALFRPPVLESRLVLYSADSRATGLDAPAGKTPGRYRGGADDRARAAPGRGGGPGSGGGGGRRRRNRRRGRSGGRPGRADRSGPALGFGSHPCGIGNTGSGAPPRRGDLSAGRF